MPSSQVEKPGMLWPPHRTAMIELLLTGEAEGRDDVVGAGRPHDQRRPTVDHAVPDRARRVVAGVVGAHDLARESVGQLAQVARSHRHWPLFYTNHLFDHSVDDRGRLH